MILLDTNYLILMLVPGSPEAQQLRAWIADHENLCTSSICWYEFVSGPVGERGRHLASAILGNRILPFAGEQAGVAARLFNATRRTRRMRIDAMIAAAAIHNRVTLATRNTSDFEPFVEHGLQLFSS
ncbi:MAG: PIN domain-containing protein [Spirochaetaceae bacterium]|nr:MAG: PIN domain-containing protein [Spirochaetaceae bacterium]